jgi:hypothetical protein
LLTGSRFAKLSYALFAVALVLALLKLGGITGAKLLSLKVAPATPVAMAAGSASKRNAPENETLDLADADGLALESAGRSPDGSMSRSVGESMRPPSSTDPRRGRGVRTAARSVATSTTSRRAAESSSRSRRITSTPTKILGEWRIHRAVTKAPIS